MTLKGIIADDEKLARDLILEYLQKYPDIDIIAQCSNGQETIETVDRLKPDLLFLDIQMPLFNGFEVLEKLAYIPAIIFSTAYSEYAIRAFEVNATDYLLKPYDQKRFDKALSRVLEKTGKQHDSRHHLADLMNHLHQTKSYASRLFIKVSDRVKPVDTGIIQWIGAQDDYTEIHTPDGSYLAGQTMAHLESILDPEQFIRIHRSSLVNLDAIKEIQKSFKGNYIVILKSGKSLPIGRTYLSRIKGKFL